MNSFVVAVAKGDRALIGKKKKTKEGKLTRWGQQIYSSPIGKWMRAPSYEQCEHLVANTFEMVGRRACKRAYEHLVANTFEMLYGKAPERLDKQTCVRL